LFVPKLAPAQHLARAAACDLFLDAFRYQAGATAVSALESGLPVLCREGDKPLSRLGCSINRTLGLDELVCPDTEAYVARAVQLARHPESLAGIRERQLQAVEAKGFFEPARVARAIEARIAEIPDLPC
jgi:predicted O-linked N-acetylglucosamine transferase (SPINDLY family)